MQRTPKTRRQRKVQAERTLSVDSDPSTDNTSDCVEDMDVAAVGQLLLQDSFLDKLVGKLSSKIEGIVVRCMAPLKAQVEKLTKELADLQEKVNATNEDNKWRNDELEQYQRRNNLRVFGVPETNGENTDELLVKLFKDSLDVDVEMSRLDRSHRVGQKQAPSGNNTVRHRAIIVRFMSYQDRRRVFTAKRKLKGTGVSIREDLTKTRLELLGHATERFGKERTWTLDGRVMWLDNEGRKGMATNLSHIPHRGTPV